MDRIQPWQSVVTRLVACLIGGGLVISVGLSVLELNRSQAALQMEAAQQGMLATRNLQAVLRGLLDPPDPEALRQAMTLFATAHPVEAIRLRGADLEPIELGRWPLKASRPVAVWPLGEQMMSRGTEVALDRPTLVQAPFTRGEQTYLLELLMDGPAAQAHLRNGVYQRLATQWLLLAAMTLLGLLGLRWWFTGPFSEVVELVGQNASPEPFRRLARRQRGEFRLLADSIADMLQRNEATAHRLAERERAFESLYQFAPAAMLSLDPAGRITEANRRAATLLGVPSERELIGQPGLAFIHEEDRPLLLQAIARLALDDATRCELRVAAAAPGGQPADPGESPRIDADVEVAAVRDNDGRLRAVRLSLLNVSSARRLQRQLEDKSRLLNLVIDHMTDAIVLIDADGRVAAFNQPLANLLNRRRESLQGAAYSHESFWDDLGIADRELFIRRLRQIEADTDRPAQERFETRAGVFRFQGIPLHDADQRLIGRLWVLQETTPQEQNQRLLNRQTHQLHVLRQVGQSLAQTRSVDGVLQRAVEQLFDLLGVDAVGIALRPEAPGERSQQILHRGHHPLLLRPHRAVIAAVEQSLLPEVMPNRDVVFWPDLPMATSWGQAFAAVGLTCVAVGPLREAHEAFGIVWIARRGGERLERHHIHVLETLTPIIAARLEIAEFERRLHSLPLPEPVAAESSSQSLVAQTID